MSGNQNQPKEFDVVKGGELPPPASGVVLGGIDGVKSRLNSDDDEVKIAALEDALKYGDEGIDLIAEALYNTSHKTHESAITLLQKFGTKGKKALLDYDPCLWFTTFKDYQINNFFNSHITNTIGVAYEVRSINELYKLVQAPKAKYLEAIRCECYYNPHTKTIFKDFVFILSQISKHLPNLTALFIGDDNNIYDRKYRKSEVNVSNIYFLLKAYPNLELLHIRGKMLEDDILKLNSQLLQISDAEINQSLKNERLKTLIIDADRISDKNLAKLCNLNLPSLEYLEIWLSRSDLKKINLNNIAPVLSGKSCPNLAYLAVRKTENTSELAKKIVNSPIMTNLRVLELTDGSLDSGGADYLLKSSAVNQLHTLNISGNRLNISTVEQFSNLNCRVITDSQFDDRYYTVWE